MLGDGAHGGWSIISIFVKYHDRPIRIGDLQAWVLTSTLYIRLILIHVYILDVKCPWFYFMYLLLYILNFSKKIWDPPLHQKLENGFRK